MNYIKEGVKPLSKIFDVFIVDVHSLVFVEHLHHGPSTVHITGHTVMGTTYTILRFPWRLQCRGRCHQYLNGRMGLEI